MQTVAVIEQVLVHSGAGWVLWLLASLSAFSFAIAVERWLYYRTRGGDLRALAATLDRTLGARDPAAALAALQESASVAAAIAAAGLRLAALGPAAVDKAMQSAVALERAGLERRLAFLGTVGNNAPFVGLFGTVIGIIGAFHELGHGAPGHGVSASAASQVASSAVMGAIAEALVTTAIGIAVALPAVALYNLLQRKVAGLLAETDVLANLVLAYVSAVEPSADSATPSAPRNSPHNPDATRAQNGGPSAEGRA